MLLVLSHPEKLNTKGEAPVFAKLLADGSDLSRFTPGEYLVLSVEKLAEFRVAAESGAVQGSAAFPPNLLFARYRDGVPELVTPHGVITLHGHGATTHDHHPAQSC